jgi:hypothetical protein
LQEESRLAAMGVRVMLALVLGVMASSGGRAQIQIGGLGAGESGARKQAVELTTATATVGAEHPDWVELRFRVAPGMHINSHSPHDELLVPTSLDAGGAGAVKVVKAEYPAGIPLRLEIGQGEVLSTYQGEFAVRLQVVAPKGDGLLDGVLRYQACDARSCYPPKTLPVRVAVTGR